MKTNNMKKECLVEEIAEIARNYKYRLSPWLYDKSDPTYLLNELKKIIKKYES